MLKTHRKYLLATAFLSGCLCGTINAQQQEKEMNAVKEQIQIGWASRDVTPRGKVVIAGQFYPRVSDQVKDPLSATALAISNSSDAFIFVSCDVSTNYVPVIDEARTRIRSKEPDFPIEKVIINATHTHTGPSIRDGKNYKLSKSELEGLQTAAENRELLINGIVGAVLESWENRKPGKVAWGFGCAVVGHNRRVVYLNDFEEEHQGSPGKVIEKNARLYGNTDVPDFSHIEGYEDHYVNFLFTYDENEKLTGSVINLASPSQETERGNMLSADFWHEVRVLLREKYGDDLFVLPQCAAGGDQVSRPLLNRRAEERMRQLRGVDSRQIIAEKIVAAFDDSFSWASEDMRSKAVLLHTVREINLSRRMPTEEEYHKNLKWIKEYEAMPKLGATQQRFLRRCQLAVERYEKMKQGHDLFLPMELHVIRLGDIAFATNSFELFLDFGVRIQEQSPAIQTFILQLAGKGYERGGSYLATKRAEAGGGYGATVYCNQVGSKGGRELVEASVNELNKLWEWELRRETYSIPFSTEESALSGNTPRLIMEMKPQGHNNKNYNHGTARLHWNDNNLYLNVEIFDPQHFNNNTGAAIWDGDALQFVLAPSEPDDYFNIVLASTPDGVQARQYDKKARILEYSKYAITRNDAKQLTCYEIIMPLKKLDIISTPGTRFYLKVVAFNDVNGMGYNDWIEISPLPGNSDLWDSRLFPEFVLAN